MATQKSFSHQTDKQRALLRSDASLIFQSSLPLARTVSTLGSKQIIGMVNTTLDDYSIEKDGVCLSLVMASKFLAITETLKIMESPNYKIEPGKILKTRKLHKELQEELKDVLYIYKKLKDNPKGLNWSLLNAYQEQYPDAQIPILLGKMDQYQTHSSQEASQKFSPKPRGRNA